VGPTDRQVPEFFIGRYGPLRRLGLLLALALAIGACGGGDKGSGVASLGGAGGATAAAATTTTTGGGDQQKASSNDRQMALNWARCMR
jgi:hypothetical protein